VLLITVAYHSKYRPSIRKETSPSINWRKTTTARFGAPQSGQLDFMGDFRIVESAMSFLIGDLKYICVVRIPG